MGDKAFTAITTQEEFDAAVNPLLKAERDKYADYAELKKKAGSVDALQSTISELNARVSNLQREAVCRKVAHEEGLPYELAGRLSGKDEDEIRADAKTLAKYVAVKKAPPLREPEPDTTKQSPLKEVLEKIRKDG